MTFIIQSFGFRMPRSKSWSYNIYSFGLKPRTYLSALILLQGRMKSYAELFTSQKQVVREVELSDRCFGHMKLSVMSGAMGWGGRPDRRLKGSCQLAIKSFNVNME